MRKLFLLLFAFFSISSYSQNKLDKSKSQLNSFSSNNKQNNISTRTSSSGASNYNNDSNVFVHIFFNITFAIFKYGAIGDYKNEDHLYSNLTLYPFYNGTSGNFENADSISISKNKSRFDLENSFVYNSNHLYGTHLKGKIRPFQYCYLQTDFHQLFELFLLQSRLE